MGLRHLHADPVVVVVPQALHPQEGGGADGVAPPCAGIYEYVLRHLRICDMNVCWNCRAATRLKVEWTRRVW